MQPCGSVVSAKPSAAPADPRIARWLPSVGDFVLLIPPLFLAAVMAGPTSIIEGDTGWHIRTGQWILAHHTVPHTDLFSYTFPGKTWYAWEWLWDAGAGWLFNHLGLSVVAMLSMLLMGLTSLVSFRTALRSSANSVAALAAVLLATSVTAIHWSARPHMVTLLCFALIVASVKSRRGLWLLPLMTAVWVNIHGGFVAELGVLGCACVASLLRAIVAPDVNERKASLRDAARFAAVAAACLAASLANPYGWHLHQHIWQTLTEYHEYFHTNIVEWQNYVYNGFSGMCLIPLAALACGGAFDALRKRDFTPAVLLSAWFFLGMTGARNVPLFAIAAVPWAASFLASRMDAAERADIAQHLRSFFLRFNSKVREFSAIDAMDRYYLAGALAWVTILFVAAQPVPPRAFRAEFATPRFPVQAVNTLLRDDPAARVFTTDEWGAYLTYRRYPETRVFIDGRIDFYGPEFARRFLDIFYGREGWQKGLDQYGVGAVLVPVKSSLVSTLKLSSGWEQCYRDPVAVMFRRRSATEPQTTGTERDRLARATLPAAGPRAQRSN